MKKFVIFSMITALLALSGCGGKGPGVEGTEVAPVATESVSAEDSTVSGSNSDMAALESDMSSIFFDFDKFNIRQDMQSNISSDAAIANGDAKAFSIKVEGNCDEWGSDEYNFALGLRRANSVKKSLVAEGVDAGRISMVSYGESNPVCTDKSRDCWAKNRRVDFKLLP